MVRKKMYFAKAMMNFFFIRSKKMELRCNRNRLFLEQNFISESLPKNFYLFIDKVFKHLTGYTIL